MHAKAAVDLGDAGEVGHQRRADRAARADDVAVGKRLGHQFHGDHVQRGEAVANDGAQFLVDALLHDLRQRVAVEFVGALEGDAAQVVLGLRPEGLEGLLALRVGNEEAHVADLLGDAVRFVDDHALGSLAAEVGKLFNISSVRSRRGCQ